MNINDAFPSRYLKASDMGDKDRVLTITGITLETLGTGDDKETKPALSIQGTEKKFVLNKTNARTIESLYGSDTNNWIGKRIAVGSRETDFQGKATLALRVSLKAPAPAAPSVAPAGEEPWDTDPADPFFDNK